MYGLVNQAVEQLLTEKFGADTWKKIKTEAGVKVDQWANMESYDDKVTYDLVGAASKVLDTPAEQLLEAFGEYWTAYTAKEGYGEFLRVGGNSVKEFLQNLNNLHNRVGMSFPKLKPPRFQTSEVTDKSLKLHYHSPREGLAPMVVGLVKGLGKMFKTEVTIKQLEGRPESDHDVFLVTYG